MKTHLTRIFFLLLIVSFLACKNPPSTTASQTKTAPELTPVENVMDPFAEDHIGKSLFHKALSVDPLWYNPEFSTYLAKVGSHVSMFSLRSALSFEFYVLDSKKIFSMGLPGGAVLISRGLLQQLDTESELAGILGTEIANIEHQYLLRLLLSSPANKDFTALFIRDEKAIDQAYELLGSGRFPDENINQSDYLGMVYAQHFGYNPQGLQDALARLFDLQVNRKEKPEKGKYNLDILDHRKSIGQTYLQNLEKSQKSFPKTKDQYQEFKKLL